MGGTGPFFTLMKISPYRWRRTFSSDKALSLGSLSTSSDYFILGRKGLGMKEVRL